MAVMSALSRHVFHPLWNFKDGKYRLRILRQLERSQWMPVESMRARQSESLARMVRYAATQSPYYERLFREQRFDAANFTKADFESLPVLTKADIRAAGEDLLSRAFPRGALDFHKTGGSTGVSLKTYFDRDWLELRSADALRSNQWAGYVHGMKVAALWGNPRLPKTLKQRLRSKLVDRFVYLDTMDFNDRSVDDFIARWRRELPEILFGHSHSLFMLARYVLAHAITDLKPRGIISTSMMLLANEREVIEAAFGRKVFDRYGCEEVGLIASECERHEGLHLCIEQLYIEFLRPDGKQAAPGEEGAIVITDLNNHGMPLIRYRIEDMGVPSERSCSCGRGMPLMERLTGRVADYLKRRDGSMVAGVSLVERTLTAIHGIEQLQVVQPSIDEIVLNVVRAADFNAASEQALLDEVRSVFGVGISVRAAYMDRIPQERSGKYRFSICKI
jgi:phenylacetate-CoA ligase